MAQLTLAQITKIMKMFVAQREWQKFHTPRNLLLALIGQVGEVSEIFQWKGQITNGIPELDEKQKHHLGEQLSDVLAYLIRLSDVCNIDLGQAFQAKMKKNAIKYPKQLVKGSAKKYNEYKSQFKQ